MQKQLRKQFSKLLMLAALLFGVNSFGQYSGSGNFTKINSLAEFTDGYYIIAYGATQAMNNTNNGTFFANTAISPTDGTTLENPAASVVWKIATNGTGKSIYNEASQTYVSYNGTGNTAAATSTATTNAERWSISYSGSLFLFQNLSFTTRYLQYNTSSPRFANYTSSQQNITLYKLTSVTTSAATALTTTSAVLNGSINPNNMGVVNAKFQYGTVTGTYGTAIDATTPTVANGTTATAISLPLTSLAVNTQYFFRAVGTQGTPVTTNNGIEQSFYTLANTPGAPTVNNATLTTLSVTVAANSNPANTTYVIRVVNGGTTQYVQANGTLGAIEVAQTAATWGTKTVTGLANATTYTFSVKAKNGAGTDTAYSTTTDGTTLANTSPTITTGGTIAALSTTYGTPSTATSFTVTSANLTADVTITAPAGFEVSLSNAIGAVFTSSVTVPQNTANNTVYIRLAATATATTYASSAISISSNGTTTTPARTVAGTVTAKALTISGLTGGTKVYDATRTALVTGVAVLSAAVNGDAISLAGTPAFNFADANVGAAKPISITGYTLTGANASNYSLTLPTLTGSITAKALTIANATAQDKVFDSFQTAVTSGTLTGVINPDVVSYTAQFAQANAGENITVNFTLAGANAGNYTLTSPAVTATITKATPTFNIQPVALGVGESRVLTNTGNEISNSNGVLTYSVNNTVTSINGSTITAGGSTGTATLTVNQAEGTNYIAGSTTVPVTVSTITYVSGDYKTLSSGTWITAISGTPVATWERYNSDGSWTSPSAAPATGTSNNLYILPGHTITAGQFANGAKLKISGTFIQNASSSTSASINVYDGGTITINGSGFVNNGEFTVENNGTVLINNAAISGLSNIWNGTENFKSGSNFIIQNWSYSDRIIASGHKFAVNANGYYFGNLNITTPTANFAIVAGNLTANLSENNFTISNTGAFAISLTNNSANVTIGGNVILNSGSFILGSANSPIITINGNLLLNSGTLNFAQTVGTPVITVRLKGNLTTVTGSTFTSGDPDSKIVFSGNTPQNVSIATLGGNIAFEIASGAEVQLINQNLALNSSNPFTVLTGGTLAFNNFNVTGAAAFTQQAGGTLKITDAAGVTTTGATGNVRSTGTRTYTAGGNFTYLGSATPQVFGNAVTNAGTITIDKTNATDVVNANAVATLGNIVVNKGTLNAGSTALGGAATNLTVSADGKYITAGTGTKPDAGGTYAINAASTIEFTGTDATDIRVTPTYGKVLVTGTNVGTSLATDGLKFATGGSFEVTNGAKFKVGNATGFSGGAATAVTTTGTPAITLGETSTVEYNGTTAQTITAFNTITGEGTEGYGNLTLKNSGASTLGANLVYARNDVKLEGTTAALTIGTGKTLKVKNQFVTNGNSVLIENNGALLQVNDVDNSGAVTAIKDNNPLYRFDYSLYSSPVFGTQTLASFSAGTVPTRFYEYGVVNNTGYYLNIPQGNATFTPAKGYLIRMPDAVANLTGYYEIETQHTFIGNFTGTPNNGDITIAANTAATRYTAVGNPYPSPISVVDFFTTNSEVINPGSGIYFWRKKNGAGTSSYATLTLAGYTRSGFIANPAPGNNSADQAQFFAGSQNDWLISQGQGFFVRTKASLPGTPLITFNNAMRRAAPISGNQAFFRTAQSTTSRLWLNITNANEEYSQSAIAYIDGTTTGLDYGYDGRQFSDANGISLYSLAEDTKLSVQARPLFNNSDVVPMGYVADVAGQLTIAIDHTDGVFSNGQDIYLRDNVLGLVHNVTDGAYTFATEAGTFNERFEVVYTADALGTTNPVLNANSVIIYKDGNSLSITTGTAIINDVTVFDIRGRKLASKTGVNAAKTAITGLDVAQQVLVIEVNTDHGKVSRKIVY